MRDRFKLIKQLDMMDCGPTCLLMVSLNHGKNISRQYLRDLCDKGQQGVSLLAISRAAEKIGFNTLPIKTSPEVFLEEALLPCIVHWKNEHFVVIYKTRNGKVYIADPNGIKIKISYEEFKTSWCGENKTGVALLLTPNKDFLTIQYEPEEQENSVDYLQYLKQFNDFLFKIGIGSLTILIINIAMPFLTQALVDDGVGAGNLSFIYIILLGQMFLFISRTASEFMQGWIAVQLGAKINISILSDFIVKLTELPLSFYGKRNTADIIQRVYDHKKIEEFLTNRLIIAIMSLLMIIVFSAILFIYSKALFYIYASFTFLSILWVTLFIKKRIIIDYKLFDQLRSTQNFILQLINGIQEIKINNSEHYYKWKWEYIQGKVFKVRLHALKIEQFQKAGKIFFTEMKNIVAIAFSAMLVVEGELTLGMMIAISYIIGQLNTPVEQLILFINDFQDAKISMDRLEDIKSLKSECSNNTHNVLIDNFSGDIKLSNISFRYSAHDPKMTINKLSTTIERNKITAIVGGSGSGKTTLIKLLLKYYEPTEGDITVGDNNLRNIGTSEWRNQCGVVLQDGYIFNDTVTMNISMGSLPVDYQQLEYASNIANIHNEIQNLIHGYDTIIGPEGVGLSGGQRQRILLARAIYKKPEVVILDEATSALDAKNEKTIHSNLEHFMKCKTVIIIAHRLSTVKLADKILVMSKGEIVESGNHESLSADKNGYYYDLVKNQLSLEV